MAWRTGCPWPGSGRSCKTARGDLVRDVGCGRGPVDGARFTVFTQADGLAGDRIGSLAEDGRGNLWFAADPDRGRGLTCLDRAQGVFITYDAEDGLGLDYARALAVDARRSSGSRATRASIAGTPSGVSSWLHARGWRLWSALGSDSPGKERTTVGGSVLQQ